MKIINEYSKFNRNIEPKVAMNIGIEEGILKCLENFMELDKHSSLNVHAQWTIGTINYKDGYFIVNCFWGGSFLKANPTYINKIADKSGLSKYLKKIVSEDPNQGKWIWEVKAEVQLFFEKAVTIYKKLTESNFERNIDPKQAMQTGIRAELNQWLKDRYSLSLDDRNAISEKAALHYAAMGGKLKFVEYLVGKGVEIPEGAISVAIQNKHADVVNYLIAAGDPVILDYINSKKRTKARFVKEALSFERNKDPRDSMQTGDVMYRQMKNILTELEKEFGGYSKIHMRREATRKYPHKSYSMNWYYPHKRKDGTIEEYKFTFWNDSCEDLVQPFNTSYRVVASKTQYSDDNPIIANADAGDEIGLVDAYIHKWLFQLIEHWEKYWQTSDDIALHRYKRKNK